MRYVPIMVKLCEAPELVKMRKSNLINLKYVNFGYLTYTVNYLCIIILK